MADEAQDSTTAEALDSESTTAEGAEAAAIPRDNEGLSLDFWSLSADAEKHEIDAEKKYIRATHCFDKGDIDEALMLIRAALSACPGNPKYHYNIGFLYWRKGLLEVAINHYKLFLRYAPAEDKDIKMIKDRVKYLEKEIKKRNIRR